ncbi:MAG: cupin domain-containing protein [Candidatus Acidoferrales bacterium]
MEAVIIGEGPPQHVHQIEDEAFYVVEGEVNVKRGEETIHARAGAFVLIPRGVTHTIWRAGSAPAKILGIFSPPGFEDYFLDTGDEDKEPDGAAYIEKAMAVAEKHNLEITGPPLG